MTMPESPLVIRNAQVVNPDGIRPADVLVEDGRITAVGDGLPADGAETLNAQNAYLLPGFVDIHCHGGNGFDITWGRYRPATDDFDTSDAAFDAGLTGFLKLKARTGTTCMLATSAAGPLDALKRSYERLADYIASDRNGTEGARIAGIFNEGTFIKRVECAGAQNPKNFYPPQLDTFDALNAAANGHVQYVMIPAEHGEAAVTLARALCERGVLVGAGHTRCGADQLKAMVAAGLRVAVHFTNGPTGTSFKPFHGGDAVEGVLTTDAVHAELICDGFHVNPRYVMDILKRKGFERCVVVTDAMFATGLKDIGTFTFGGMKGEVDAEQGFMRVVGKGNTLFGSALSTDEAFGNVASWLTRGMEGIWNRTHPALERDEAIVQTARMMSWNPAALIGIADTTADTPGRGRIAEGCAADLLLARIEGEPGALSLNVLRTLIAGRTVYPSRP